MGSKQFVLYDRREDCSGCCACASVCAHGAIRMETDGMGFRYPVIDRDSCVECGLCEKVCAFHPVVRNFQPVAEAVRFPDYLSGSQSGGVGYALMRQAVTDGWVVYGAAMDADYVVRHRRVVSLEGLEPLRLSKYVQSDMDGIPGQVLKDLKEGRRVLFTGTPCQCAGVGSLCARYRENLLLVDLICHGVPSPEVWKGFLDWNASRQSSPVREAVFRDPALGWHDNRALLAFDSGERIHSDSYFFLFINNMMSRPSCGRCPFASTQRPSDITIGDCWGVEQAAPGFSDDERGCSLVLLHSQRGEGFYASVADAGTHQVMDLTRILQPSLVAPSVPSRWAGRFERDFLRKGFAFVQARYGKDSLLHRCNLFLQKVKRHLPL